MDDTTLRNRIRFLDTLAGDTFFPLTRSASLARLATFAPQAGAAYGRLRNFDKGQDGHIHVSRLSAALRRRVITEDEVITAVLTQHGTAAAEKFISEVFWRTYWKGWLEQRPAVWTGYLQAVSEQERRLQFDRTMARRMAIASEGQTGIDCFDAWSLELRDTGYLHNWSRMQFASIWIFTLGLPWELGAAFMLDQLSDGDPASNTLSWRWVAGLHTAGKSYLADAERIKAMTSGRFSPKNLARHAAIPADSIVVPPATLPRAALSPDVALPSLMLLTSEDLSLETLPWPRSLPVRALAVLPGRSEADRIAIEDGLERAKHRWPQANLLGPLTPSTLPAAKAAGCEQIITGFAPVGPTAAALDTLRRAVGADGIRLTEYLRGWDARAWPHCRKGFFALKEQIPALLATRGNGP